MDKGVPNSSAPPKQHSAVCRLDRSLPSPTGQDGQVCKRSSHAPALVNRGNRVSALGESFGRQAQLGANGGFVLALCKALCRSRRVAFHKLLAQMGEGWD